LTLEEAKKVAVAASHADSGCSHCAWQVGDVLAKDFPEFDWDALLNEAFEYEEFDEL
jgi:hypothetical protein